MVNEYQKLLKIIITAIIFSPAFSHCGHSGGGEGFQGLKRSGVDTPLCPSRACLHTAFIAFSVPFEFGGSRDGYGPCNISLAGPANAWGYNQSVTSASGSDGRYSTPPLHSPLGGLVVTGTTGLMFASLQVVMPHPMAPTVCRVCH